MVTLRLVEIQTPSNSVGMAGGKNLEFALIVARDFGRGNGTVSSLAITNIWEQEHHEAMEKELNEQ